MVRRCEVAMGSYDYANYFNSFGHPWTKLFLLHVGLLQDLVQVTLPVFTDFLREEMRLASLSLRTMDMVKEMYYLSCMHFS